MYLQHVGRVDTTITRTDGVVELTGRGARSRGLGSAELIGIMQMNAALCT